MMTLRLEEPTNPDALNSPISAGFAAHSDFAVALERAAGAPNEEDAWDAFVARTPGGDILQTAAWGRSKVAMGFQAAVAYTCDPTGQLEGGGLIIAKRVRPIPGVAPGLTAGYVSRGPLLRSQDAGAVGRVLDAIERQAKSLGIAHLIIQPPAGHGEVVRQLEMRGYDSDGPELAPTRTLVVDLDRSLDAVVAGMAGSQRRNLRKLEKLPTVVRMCEEGDIPTFHALHVASAARHGYKPVSLEYLITQWRALRPIGAVAGFLAAPAHAPDRPIAGGWVTGYAGTVKDKLPAWAGESPNLQPNLACIWAAIRWAHDRRFTRYDLGGLDHDVAAAVLAGQRLKEVKGERAPAAFKLRFGGQVQLLPGAYQRTFNPCLAPVVRFAWRTLAGRPRFKAFLSGIRNG